MKMGRTFYFSHSKMHFLFKTFKINVDAFSLWIFPKQKESKFETVSDDLTLLTFKSLGVTVSLKEKSRA